MSTPRFICWLCIALPLGSSLGCSGSAESNNQGAGAVAGALAVAGSSNCPPGAETCACYGNDTCNNGLTCASHLCVRLGTGGAASSGGTSATGLTTGLAGLGNEGGGNGGGGSDGVINNGPVAGSSAVATGGSDGTAIATSPGGLGTSGNATGGGSTSTLVGLGGTVVTSVTTIPTTGGAPTDCTLAGGCSPPGTGSCGDGLIDQASEACDDGNTIPGDGCNGICQVEGKHLCPVAGQTCQLGFICGDGVLNPGEACDQGLAQGSPGCSVDCTRQEPGYQCQPAQACLALFICGNGRIESGETCDPPSPGNGCGANCQTENGWRCKPGSCAQLSRCGDGILQPDRGEKCDQGEYQGSPGCSADCRSLDVACTCVPGKACVCVKPTCGDGIVQVGEQCDDKKNPAPGCSDTCQLEKGYKCPLAGAPCVPECGDGVLTKPAEQCDPKSTVPNVAVACASDCTVKPGWVCDTTSCHQTVCGDGKIEGTEGCDPSVANNDLGDGCTPTCMTEPACPGSGGACTTKCGDGMIVSTEECDDGNAVSGDGCSSECKVEAGFTCSLQTLGDTVDLPLVVRDFNAGADFEKGAAFAQDLNYATQGLLKSTLDSTGLKPELQSTVGTYNGSSGKDSGIASAASFAQWYKDAASGPNGYNKTLTTTLHLFRIASSDPPTFVNRFGSNGDGLTSSEFLRTIAKSCGEVGKEDHDASGNALPCTVCYYDPDPATPQCDLVQLTDCQKDPTYTECVKSSDGRQWLGVYVAESFDGNPLFFPADPITPANPSAEAQIPGNYAPSWPTDPTGKKHNFSFTTETRFWFKYDATKTYQLKFVGDDDVWVFVNKRLAMDIGGIHTAVKGVLTLSGGVAAVTVSNTNPVDQFVNINSQPVLGTLQNGGLYEVVVFQAERQTKASSYSLSLTGFAESKSVCKPICGGTNPGVSPGEQCDNGDTGNCDPGVADCYNKCTSYCTLGPRCGDGAVQADHEQCDNGKNTDGYAAAGTNACAPDCRLPPFCGDGKVQTGHGEQCDAGASNQDGSYSGCTTQCKFGSACGDGIANGDAAHPEACDDGINDGTYGTCSPGCTPPPRCGDGVIQSAWGEACEPVASNDSTCTADCRLPGYCGDGRLDQAGAELCDNGSGNQDGLYGGCNSNCTLGAFCGDGVTNGPEQCDDGVLDGSYGTCSAHCLLGSRCGDGVVQTDHEQCDSGPNNGQDGVCSRTCQRLSPKAGDPRAAARADASVVGAHLRSVGSASDPSVRRRCSLAGLSDFV